MLASAELVVIDGVVVAFVVSVVAFGLYALVRPFTHLHYRRENTKLWRPLP